MMRQKMVKTLENATLARVSWSVFMHDCCCSHSSSVLVVKKIFGFSETSNAEHHIMSAGKSPAFPCYVKMCGILIIS